MLVAKHIAKEFPLHALLKNDVGKLIKGAQEAEKMPAVAKNGQHLACCRTGARQLCGSQPNDGQSSCSTRDAVPGYFSTCGLSGKGAKLIALAFVLRRCAVAALCDSRRFVGVSISVPVSAFTSHVAVLVCILGSYNTATTAAFLKFI